MSIKSTYYFKTFKQLYRERDVLNFNHPVQRNGEVWKSDKKSLFIHSLLYGYPVPPAYAIEGEDGIQWIIDGKQRITNLFSFIEGQYALYYKTPVFKGVKLAGKKFDDLPEEFQDIILGASLQVYLLHNLTPMEIHETFLRLNNGVPLSRFEITRSITPANLLTLIQEIKNMKFFKDTVNIQKTARNRFVDEELILQIILLLENNKQALTISGKAIRNAIESLAVTGISEETEKELKDTAEYLGEALPKLIPSLRKVHVPPLFVTAAKALEMEVPAAMFKEWTDKWFVSGITSQIYSIASMTGSTGHIQVQQRISEMDRHFQEFLKRKSLVTA